MKDKRLFKATPMEREILIFVDNSNNVYEGRTGGGGGGGGGGGLWHDSRTKKITNHGSRKLKFHFPESRK